MQINIEINYRTEEHLSQAYLFHAIKQLLPQLDERLINISVSSVRKVIKTPITIDFISKEVCNYFCVPTEKLNTPTRKREVVQARQVSHFFSKNLTKHSLENIGKEIGHKNHATVLHSIKTVNNLMTTNKQYRSDIESIRKILING